MPNDDLKYAITPGTHPEVWIFESLHTIAVNYTEVGEVVEGVPGTIDEIQSRIVPADELIEGDMFSSSAFFFDYKKAWQDAWNDARWKMGYITETEKIRHSEGNPFWNPNDYPDDIFNNYRPSKEIGRTRVDSGPALKRWDWPPSMKFFWMYLSWREYLVATKKKPPWQLLPNFYYGFYDAIVEAREYESRKDIIDKFRKPDGTLVDLHRPMGIDKTEKFKDLYDEWDEMTDYEKLNIISPLAHFPSLRHCSLLKEKVFSGPGLMDDIKDRIHIDDEYFLRKAVLDKYERMKWYYGPEIAGRLYGSTENIYYGDLIDWSGDPYDLWINLNPIGIRASFKVPFTNFAFNENYLARLLETAVKGKQLYGDQYGVTIEQLIIDDIYWPPPHEAIKRSFEARDNWIARWLYDGLIPHKLDMFQEARIRPEPGKPGSDQWHSTKLPPYKVPSDFTWHDHICSYEETFKIVQSMSRRFIKATCLNPFEEIEWMKVHQDAPAGAPTPMPENLKPTAPAKPYMLRGDPAEAGSPTCQIGELEFVYTGEDPLTAFFQFIFMITSVTVAICTGNVTQLIKSAGKILNEVIKAIEPDLAPYTNLILPVISASLSKEFKIEDPDQMDKATSMLMTVAGPMLEGEFTSVIEDFKTNAQDMLTAVDKNLTQREKSILEAIGERVGVMQAVRDVQRVAYLAAPGMTRQQIYQRGGHAKFFARAVGDLIDKKQSDGQTRKIITYSAIGVGVLALLKYAKK